MSEDKVKKSQEQRENLERILDPGTLLSKIKIKNEKRKKEDSLMFEAEIKAKKAMRAIKNKKSNF